MNKKGQMGAIMMVFIGVIVGITLFLTISQTVGTATSTVAVANESIATVVNGTAQYLTNYVYIESVVIVNETNGVVIGAGNYTITNNVVHDGAEVVQIMPQATNAFKTAWKVSGTAQPQGYVGGAGRSIALIIPILMALAIAVIAIEPTLRNGFKEMVGI